jgi:hypothetical protein
MSLTHCLRELCVGTGAITSVDVPYCPQREETPYEWGRFPCPLGAECGRITRELTHLPRPLSNYSYELLL